jgi:hypothetical protein
VEGVYSWVPQEGGFGAVTKLVAAEVMVEGTEGAGGSRCKGDDEDDNAEAAICSCDGGLKKNQMEIKKQKQITRQCRCRSTATYNHIHHH